MRREAGGAAAGLRGGVGTGTLADVATVSPSPRTQVPSLGCGYLVCAVLLAIGIGLLFAAQAKWDQRQAADAWVSGAIGGVFCLAGVGLIAPMQRAVARAKERARRESAKPDEPWTWDPAWTRASGIPQSGRRSGAVLLAVGAMAVAFSLPGWFAIPGQLARGNYAVLLVLIFPALGLALLSAAGLDRWRRRKYGTARFVPAAIPLPHGGDVAGFVIVDRFVAADRPGRVTLDCWKATLTRSGNKRQRREEAVAHLEREIEPSAWAMLAGESRIFVQLPARGGEPTSMAPLDLGRPTFEWRLRVHVPTVGADFVAEFVLPVFALAGVAPAGGPERPMAARTDVWRAAGVREEPLAGAVGDTALVLPAKVGRVHATGPLAMAVVLGGVAGALWFSPMPIIFPLFLSGFALLPLLAVWSLLQAGGERLWVEREAVCSERNGQVRRLALAELGPIEQRASVSVGSKAFFRVESRPRVAGPPRLPKKFVFAALVPGRETAEHVVAWLQERVDEVGKRLGATRPK